MRRAGSCLTELEAAQFDEPDFVAATVSQKERLRTIAAELEEVKQEVTGSSEKYLEETFQLVDLYKIGVR